MSCENLVDRFVVQVCDSKSCKGVFLKINFSPMRALEIVTSHVIYNSAYTYKYQLKTTSMYVGTSNQPNLTL